MMLWLFDILMLVCLFWLAWNSLAAKRIEVGVMTFLPYGLLMALLWARLSAPDIAIAEAAIGAGLTTALLFAATRRLKTTKHQTTVSKKKKAAARSIDRKRKLAAGAVSLGTFVAVSMAVIELPSAAQGLSPEVAANIDESGAGNPVTAVLLNFRGYDTLLEVAVLLLAVIGVSQLRKSTDESPSSSNALPSGSMPLLQSLIHVFIPLMVLVSGYLLWRGGDSPGGAFQAGALLAGAGVLLILLGVHRPSWLKPGLLRLFMASGLVVFGLVAVAVMAGGGSILEYPKGSAKPLILVIEVFAAVSIGLILTQLFYGVAGHSREHSLGGER